MKQGKLKYSYTRPIAMVFFLAVSCIGAAGIYMWWSGALPILFDTDSNADIFPKMMAVLFLGVGLAATVSTWLTGPVRTRTDKVSLDDLTTHEYDNGLLVVSGNQAKFFTDGLQRTVKRRGYVKIEHTFCKDNSHTFKIIY